MFNNPIRIKGRNTFIRENISELSFQGVEIDIAADDIEIRDCVFIAAVFLTIFVRE